TRLQGDWSSDVCSSDLALGDEYVYLFLDGVVLKVRDARGKVRRRVVLVAYGVTPAGRREVLAYRLAQAESETAWTAFLQDLYLRSEERRVGKECRYRSG